MTFFTTIEYLDGKVAHYPHRILIRCDGVAQVYRILEELVPGQHNEVTIPYNVVRKQTTIIIHDKENKS